MTNWKSLVEKSSAKTYSLPPGWSTKAEVAEQLECSEDRVNVHLGPALKAKEVETQVFPLWDEITKRVIRVTAYRETPSKAVAKIQPSGAPGAGKKQ